MVGFIQISCIRCDDIPKGETHLFECEQLSVPYKGDEFYDFFRMETQLHLKEMVCRGQMRMVI